MRPYFCSKYESSRPNPAPKLEPCISSRADSLVLEKWIRVVQSPRPRLTRAENEGLTGTETSSRFVDGAGRVVERVAADLGAGKDADTGG